MKKLILMMALLPLCNSAHADDTGDFEALSKWTDNSQIEEICKKTCKQLNRTWNNNSSIYVPMKWAGLVYKTWEFENKNDEKDENAGNYKCGCDFNILASGGIAASNVFDGLSKVFAGSAKK